MSKYYVNVDKVDFVDKAGKKIYSFTTNSKFEYCRGCICDNYREEYINCCYCDNGHLYEKE